MGYRVIICTLFFRPEALDKMSPQQMEMIMSRMVARKNNMCITKATRQLILNRGLVSGVRDFHSAFLNFHFYVHRPSSFSLLFRLQEYVMCFNMFWLMFDFVHAKEETKIMVNITQTFNFHTS